jgi:histidyl-tRNA synthetase
MNIALTQVKKAVARPVNFYIKTKIEALATPVLTAIESILFFLEEKTFSIQSLSILDSLIRFSQKTSSVWKTVSGLLKQKLPNEKKRPIGVLTKKFTEQIISPDGIRQLPFISDQRAKSWIPKPPLGTRDLLPLQMRIREKVLNLITEIFDRHGAVFIETPVFELKEVLTEKYGEEAKLIYNLEDQGGELLSLRYDLTVPLARFVSIHGIYSIKTYQIGKVYRRDKPSISRGRFREFYQCDFDIAGPSDPMISDSEVVAVIYEILEGIGKMEGVNEFDFEIRVSHRQMIAAMIKVSEIPSEQFKFVCRAIDKLVKFLGKMLNQI